MIDNRIKECVTLGLRYDFHSTSYVMDDINIAMVEIKTLDKEKWSEMIKKVDAEIKRHLKNNA